MDDAGVGRHDDEVAEGLLAPAEELVALAVALKLAVGVGAEGEAVAEVVHLHRVVDDQLGRQQRVDLLGVAAHPLHGVAHGGEVHHGRDAGEVLQQHASRREGNFLVRLGLRVPLGQGRHVGGADGLAVLGAEEVFEEDLERVRQAGGLWGAFLATASRRKTV